MDWRPIYGGFLSHTHCSWDSLQIHHDADQDKVILKIKILVRVVVDPKPVPRALDLKC